MAASLHDRHPAVVTRRLLRYSGVAVLLALLLLFVAALWLTRTTPGARWLWDTATGYVPGQLAAESVDGTFAGGLELQNLTYASEAVEIGVTRLVLAVDPVLFPSIVVNVRELVAEGVVVRQKETGEPDQPDEPILEKLALPIEVNVARLFVSDLRILDTDGESFVAVNQAELAGQWHESLSLTRMHIENDAGSLDGRLRLGLSRPHDTDTRVEVSYLWRMDEETEVPVHLTLAADGDLDDLRVELDATEPELRVTGWLYRLMDEPAWDLRVLAQHLQWPLSGPSPEVYLREANIESSGSLRDYSLSGDGRVAAQGSGDVQFDVALNGNRDGFDVTSLVLDGEAIQAGSTGALRWGDTFSIAADADIAHADPSVFTNAWPDGTPVEGAVDAVWSAGSVELNEVRARVPATGAAIEAGGIVDVDDGVVDVDLDWRELAWPVQAASAESAFTSEFGRLRVRGRLEDWQFEGRAAFSADDLPQGIFRLSGSGSTDHVEATLAESQVLGGSVQGEIAYHWRDGGSWRAALRTENLHIEPLAPDWPGTISSDFTTAGRLDPLEVEADIDSLSGTVRDRPVTAEGGLHYVNGSIRAEEFRVASGESFLRADGSVREPDGLDFAIQADALARFHPAVAGALSGTGNVSLAGDFPRVRADLLGEDLRWGDFGLESLTVTSEGMPADAPVALAASGEVLSVGAREFENFSLKLTADEDRQQLALEISPGEETVGLEVDGRFGNWRRPLESGWAGSLLALWLEVGDDKRYSLAEAAALQLGPERYSVAGACLTGGTEESLCVDGTWSGGTNFEVAAELAAIPVNLVQLFVDTPLDFTQTLDGSLHVSNSADGAPVGEGRIDIRPGRIGNERNPGVALETGPGVLRFSVADGQRLTGELALPFAEASEVEAEWQLANINRGGDSELEAAIRMHLQDIAVAAEVAPMLEEAEGTLDVSMWLGGTLSSPVWAGEASLRDGALTYAPVGLALSGIELDAALDEDHELDLASTFRAGEGTGEIRSTPAAPGDSGINVTVTGDNLTLIDLPDINIAADMDLRVGVQDRRLTVNGGILVPRARITPVNLTSGKVSESEDVVIVAGEQAEEDATDDEAPPFAFIGTVGLQLGRDVVVDLDVAEARLTGTTAFTWNGPPTPVANGQYGIEGRFEAYGQLLEITEGRILFPGVPATEPQLRLRAEREIFGNPQIRSAGVLVTGPATNPEVEVYTNPATTEDRALTLLVTGSDFNYEQGVGAVDVGTYIAPDLYISYGIGLFERDNVISVRYDIARGFGIKATSGRRAEGVDLSYTIER